MNRRQFIRYSGGALVMAGGASLLYSLRQLEIRKREMASVFAAGLEGGLAEVLYLAALAPSGHNTQPWTVTVITSRHWLIGTDSSRWLPAVDPQNREMMISLGAFLENLAAAARSQGYEAEIQILAQSTTDQVIAAVKLYKRSDADPSLIRQIQLRRTVRSNFLPQKIADEDRQRIALGETDNNLYYASGSQESRSLAEATALANEIQVYRDAAQAELAGWIRWSNEDCRKYGNGLIPETMEIEGVSRWYVKNFYTYQSVLTKEFREATIQRVNEQVKAGGGWLVLTSKDVTVVELIRTGRNLQRIWLKLRERNLALHPMTQALEEAATAKALPAALGITSNIQLVLRIGYVSHYPDPVSPRMPLQSIII
ncbi:Acg family FMN-binding oxidoreductase [Anaerospora hongkongensis]|uniref:Acg family FMN-binding oxidoreductase n=1 Tax=Anaerospora hongkongensis TaxID=244830 RepID=UPI00289825F8|nr:nitroreductase [Anaerospora hongkongensis]